MRGPCAVYAVDAKLNFDDNAAFRQKAIYALRDKSMEDPRDVAAEEIGLNYIGLSGNIGCLGAWLGPASMSGASAACVCVSHFSLSLIHTPHSPPSQLPLVALRACVFWWQ